MEPLTRQTILVSSSPGQFKIQSTRSSRHATSRPSPQSPQPPCKAVVSSPSLIGTRDLLRVLIAGQQERTPDVYSSPLPVPLITAPGTQYPLLGASTAVIVTWWAVVRKLERGESMITNNPKDHIRPQDTQVAGTPEPCKSGRKLFTRIKVVIYNRHLGDG